MSDETTQIIAGDTLAAASEEYPRARRGLLGPEETPPKRIVLFHSLRKLRHATSRTVLLSLRTSRD